MSGTSMTSPVDALGRSRCGVVAMMGRRRIHHVEQLAERVLRLMADQVTKLIAALWNGSKTAVEVIVKLGLVHRPTFGNNYFQPASQRRWLVMTRSESPTVKNQKYRRTASGRAIL